MDITQECKLSKISTDYEKFQEGNKPGLEIKKGTWVGQGGVSDGGDQFCFRYRDTKESSI